MRDSAARVPDWRVTVCSPMASATASVIAVPLSPCLRAYSRIRAAPARRSPSGPFVVFEQSQGGVAFDAVAGQRAFERGVQVQEQTAQPVDRTGEFVRGVLVPAGQQAERGHGLVVGFAVPERFGHARGGGRDDAGVSAVGLRAARQQLGGLAHRAPGQVCRAGAHVPGDGQRERAYRVGLVHDYEDRAPAL